MTGLRRAKTAALCGPACVSMHLVRGYDPTMQGSLLEQLELVLPLTVSVSLRLSA